MSNKSDLARRVEIKLVMEGVKGMDVNKYLTSMTYTDNEEDKTDDLQIEIDDREGEWLSKWLANGEEADATRVADQEVKQSKTVKHTVVKGDTLSKIAQTYLGSASRHPEIAAENNIKNPNLIYAGQVLTITIEGEIKKETSNKSAEQEAGEPKKTEIHATIIQKNWNSDGKDRVLDCGVFEVDSVDASGPPARVAIKGTSIPYTSTIRTQKKTKAWEKIKLSTIANEIASINGLQCMYESDYDPIFTRKEQVQQSDIVFLQGLCKDMGISLKVTSKTIVLFDAAAYENKPTVLTLKRGESDIVNYRFSTNLNDTAYSSCRVSYTDPNTKKTIEYTYKPKKTETTKEGTGQVLEINEKVKTREEARQLAMKRLRQKNKAEYQASFTLVGNALLVAGVTVKVVGFGAFSGKYIVETAEHQVTKGYKTNVKLRKVLEGY